MSARSNALPIPQDHIEALRAVDLHLYFDIHGRPVNLGQRGPAVLGVTDAEYQRASQVVEDLEPERGDVLAQEEVGFRFEWRLIRHLNDMWSLAEKSPLINTPVEARLIQNSQAKAPAEDAIRHNDFYHSDPDTIRAFASEMRRFRIIAPPHYAGVLAVAKGLPVRIADASAHEMKIHRKENNDLPFRDLKMVTRLGSIAASMDIHDPDNPPRLGFTAGDGHAPGVSRILKAIDVPFTSHIQRSGLRDHLAKLARIYSLSSKSSEQKDIDDWMTNVHRELAK